MYISLANIGLLPLLVLCWLVFFWFFIKYNNHACFAFIMCSFVGVCRSMDSCLVRLLGAYGLGPLSELRPGTPLILKLLFDAHGLFSYMLAKLLDLSGILAVFFDGILMSHYTWHNVTESSRVTTKWRFSVPFTDLPRQLLHGC